LQLAIAPAGAGKTTAMRALTLAWTNDGGQVIGLAPSAAAAAVLAEHTGIPSDTLAKLTWSLGHGELPDFAARIGQSTLVIIDEAGMADTLTLDRVVGLVVALGGSVRLIGDDQQLAAIGAGGVLRDIKHTHGALQLTELYRFTDPAEAEASLALRDGDPKSLTFYLNHGRVHVGDLATTSQEAFTGWAADRAGGLDAIMLAPTRQLVADLNRRARTHRLDGAPAGREVRLADGNQASVGDVIITRSNDRRLRLSATDWVKNGDRWTITHISRHGDLAVRHTRSHLTARLPAHYVGESAGLGYATTVHAAQGVTADTMHGLATGQESRQQLYTMLTRGRRSNHLYLQVVGDGDPHTIIRPETITPRTPTEMLEQILARDQAPTSAGTLLRRVSDPAARLYEAVQRYTDALHAAAEQIVGPHRVAMLDSRADQVVPDVTNEPAWPTLRANLLALGAETGDHPLLHLYRAALGCDLSTAEDMTAVLNWRLPEPAPTQIRAPLVWLPGIPQPINDHPDWGQYLAQRSDLIANLAQHIQHRAGPDGIQPVWAPPGTHLDVGLIGEVAVWRAANGIDPHDRRPSGPAQLQTLPALWQRDLDRRIQHTDKTFDNSVHEERAASKTFKGLRPEDRHHSPQPSEINRRPLPAGPSP
jgi:hypothetical protein